MAAEFRFTVAGKKPTWLPNAADISLPGLAIFIPPKYSNAPAPATERSRGTASVLEVPRVPEPQSITGTTPPSIGMGPISTHTSSSQFTVEGNDPGEFRVRESVAPSNSGERIASPSSFDGVTPPSISTK